MRIHAPQLLPYLLNLRRASFTRAGVVGLRRASSAAFFCATWQATSNDCGDDRFIEALIAQL